MRNDFRICLLLTLGLLVLGATVASAGATAGMSEDDFVAALASGADLPVGDSAVGTVPEPTNLSGCSASYICVHGGTVSCTGQVNGTCFASGGGCGWVSCDGEATVCPGRCRPWLPIECWSFCPSIGKDPVGCDEFGCCICE